MPLTLMRARFCTCILAGLAGACAADSAVPTPDVLPAAAWSLSAEPVMEIGVADGPAELMFTTIANAFALADGRIVVANRATPAEVRVFSSEGEHLRTFGRHGEGPGEYRAIAWVRAVHYDSVVVYDPWLQRVTWLSATDGFARAQSTVLPGTDARSGTLALLAPVRESMFLARPNRILGDDATGAGRSHRPLLLVGFDPPVIDTLLVLEGAQFVTDDGEQRLPLFGVRSAISYRAGRVFVGHGDEFRVDEYTLDGEHVRTFHRSIERRPVTEAVVQVAARAAIQAASEEERPQVEARYRDMPRAEHLPAHTTSMLVDDSGHLWVEEYALPGEPRAWSVFDPVGAWLCSVQVPSSLRLTHVGRDAVYGIHRDDLGVESVRVYALRR